jgi:hypothetical protein
MSESEDIALHHKTATHTLRSPGNQQHTVESEENQTMNERPNELAPHWIAINAKLMHCFQNSYIMRNTLGRQRRLIAASELEHGSRLQKRASVLVHMRTMRAS